MEPAQQLPRARPAQNNDLAKKLALVALETALKTAVSVTVTILVTVLVKGALESRRGD